MVIKMSAAHALALLDPAALVKASLLVKYSWPRVHRRSSSSPRLRSISPSLGCDARSTVKPFSWDLQKCLNKHNSLAMQLQSEERVELCCQFKQFNFAFVHWLYFSNSHYLDFFFYFSSFSLQTASLNSTISIFTFLYIYNF